ncbi:MAG: hypothetical protein RRA94_01195 [Bacteroidota bacterium]|nr:hypothetical protein [Bacteroidota bacterium]
MRVLSVFLLLIMFTSSAFAAQQPGKENKRSFRASDGASIDAIVRALYAAVSGNAGQKGDWTRLRNLFIDEARLRPVIWKGESDVQLRSISVEEYIRFATQFFSTRSFHEREVGRRVERFGHIAHVFSTYESYHEVQDPVPFTRGINSIQLYHDGSRWWIVSVLWDEERAGSPIPGDYLAGP